MRAWIFAIWIIMIVQDPFPQMAELPPGLVTRVGPLKLIPHSLWPTILHPNFLAVFKLVLVVVLALAMLGSRPYVIIAATTAIMLTVQQGIVEGLGHQSHGTLAILLVTYVLAVCPAADGFTVYGPKAPSRSSTYDWALTVMALTLLLTYTFIAAYRIAYSSPEIFLSDSMRYFIALNFFQKPGGLPFQPQLVSFLIQTPRMNTMLNGGFAVVTMFELLAPLCLISRIFRYGWLVVIVPFHFLTLLTMKIFFWQNLLLISVLLFNIEPVLAKCSQFSLSRRLC